jgi:hypothetical protein
MAHDMGIGKLGGHEIVFVRQFRFLLSGEHLEAWYTKAATFDVVSKLLEIKAYEVTDGTGKVFINNWVEAMVRKEYPDETLTLLTLDGCGNEIYKRVFKGLSIVSTKNVFDMESSDEGNTNVTIRFESCEYEDCLNGKHEHCDPSHSTVEINHLNAKTFIP